jgi:hypothetical protein
VRNRRVRARWAAVGGALILLLALVLLLWQPFWGLPAPEPHTTTGQSSVPRPADHDPPGALEVDDELNPPATESAAAMTGDTFPDPQETPVQPLVPHDERYFPLIVRFIDAGGVPLRHFSFGYALMEVDGYNQTRATAARMASLPRQLHRLFPSTGKTDEAGDWLVNLSEGQWLGVYTPDSAIRFESVAARGTGHDSVAWVRARLRMGEGSERVIQRVGQVMRLTAVVSHDSSVLLSIAYDDGAPYTGPVRWWREGRSAATMYMSEGGPIELPVLGDKPMTVSATSITRMGYGRGQHFELSAVDVQSGHVQLTLESGQRQQPTSGMLILDLREIEAGQVVHVSLHLSNGLGGYLATVEGPGLYPLGAVTRPEGGFIHLSGDVSWKSDLIVVPVGEEKVVAPDFGDRSSVTFLVVDESGEPIAGALLHQGGRARAAHPSIHAMSGLSAQADSEGVVTLGGLSAGTHNLFVTAFGFEGKSRPVSVAEGEDRARERVVLTKSTARLAVRLVEDPNIDSEALALVLLLFPERSHYLPGVKFNSDGVVVLDALPSGSYVFLISHFSRGGSFYSQHIHLTPGQDKEITVNLRRRE